MEKTVYCDVVLHSFTKVSFVQITNHTVGGEFGQPKPALGESWKRIPDVRLLLTHDPSSNACEVAVIKHSSIVSPLKLQHVCFLFLIHVLLQDGISICSMVFKATGSIYSQVSLNVWWWAWIAGMQ